MKWMGPTIHVASDSGITRGAVCTGAGAESGGSGPQEIRDFIPKFPIIRSTIFHLQIDVTMFQDGIAPRPFHAQQNHGFAPEVSCVVF